MTGRHFAAANTALARYTHTPAKAANGNAENSTATEEETEIWVIF